MVEPSELISRVEQATGPDREIDLALGLAVDGWELVSGLPLVRVGRDTFAARPGGMYPALTESVDEALALIERVLPGWRPWLNRLPISSGLGWEACIVPDDSRVMSEEPARAPTPALSIILALLRSLHSKGTEDNG